MEECAICHHKISGEREAIHRKRRRSRHVHPYCRWRAHNFWCHDVISIIAYFSINLVCFLFLIIAGAVANDTVLRNTAYLVLVWDFLFSGWLFFLAYLKMVDECCDHHHTKRRRRGRNRHRIDDEIVTKEDVYE